MPTKLPKTQEVVFWNRTNNWSPWLQRLEEAGDFGLDEVKEFTPATSPTIVMAVMTYSVIQVNVTKISTKKKRRSKHSKAICIKVGFGPRRA
jgi:hypothetical protein